MDNDNEKTRWFSAQHNPSRVGWYEVRCKHGIFSNIGIEKLFFDAYGWHMSDKEIVRCSFGAGGPCDSWRGLKKRPSETRQNPRQATF